MCKNRTLQSRGFYQNDFGSLPSLRALFTVLLFFRHFILRRACLYSFWQWGHSRDYDFDLFLKIFFFFLKIFFFLIIDSGALVEAEKRPVLVRLLSSGSSKKPLQGNTIEKLAGSQHGIPGRWERMSEEETIFMCSPTSMCKNVGHRYVVRHPKFGIHLESIQLTSTKRKDKKDVIIFATTLYIEKRKRIKKQRIKKFCIRLSQQLYKKT